MSKRPIGKKFSGGFIRPSDTVNQEQYPAWTKPLEEMFKQIMFNGFIRNTFYVDEKQLIDTAVDIIKRFVKENPLRALELARKGRNDGFMRTLPIVALSYASLQDREFFQVAFLSIIKTPRDLEQFIDITRGHRGLGRAIKTMINAYIHENLTPFYTYRYKKQLQLAMKLAHPKIKDKIKDAFARYIMEKEELSWESSEVPIEIRAIEELKGIQSDKLEHPDKLSTYENLQCSLIKNGRLHPDVVKGILAPTKEMWDLLVDNSPAMYLVKNLVAFSRHIGPQRLLEKLKSGMLSIERMKKGRVLPFRLMQAWSMFPKDMEHEYIRNWIADLTSEYAKAYDYSNLGRVAVCPDISGSMGVCPDISGSMGSCWTVRRGKQSTLTYSQMAGLFAGIFCIGIKDSALLPWEGKVRMDYFNRYPRWRNLETIWDLCQRTNNGTSMEAPVRFMIANNLNYDTCIFITDTEEWMGSGWIRAWMDYKKQMNSKAKAVLIRIDPYNTNPFPFDEAEKWDIYQIYGVSDTVFKMLEVLGKDGKA